MGFVNASLAHAVYNNTNTTPSRSHSWIAFLERSLAALLSKRLLIRCI